MDPLKDDNTSKNTVSPGNSLRNIPTFTYDTSNVKRQACGQLQYSQLPQVYNYQLSQDQIHQPPPFQPLTHKITELITPKNIVLATAAYLLISRKMNIHFNVDTRGLFASHPHAYYHMFALGSGTLAAGGFYYFSQLKLHKKQLELNGYKLKTDRSNYKSHFEIELMKAKTDSLRANTDSFRANTDSLRANTDSLRAKTEEFVAKAGAQIKHEFNEEKAKEKAKAQFHSAMQKADNEDLIQDSPGKESVHDRL